MSYLLEAEGNTTGYGSVAKPTVFEFYLLPEHRSRAFHLFEALLVASGARFFEVQTNDPLTTCMALTCGREIVSEAMVFHDKLTTTHLCRSGVLQARTSDEGIRAAMERRQGGGEWVIELDGTGVGKGGILFHYNRPYGDTYMEVNESSRRRGLGSFLVQELKRECYRLGAVPCARCNPTNVPSRLTLQRAGFVPCAHILIGSIAPSPATPDSRSAVP